MRSSNRPNSSYASWDARISAKTTASCNYCSHPVCKENESSNLYSWHLQTDTTFAIRSKPIINIRIKNRRIPCFEEKGSIERATCVIPHPTVSHEQGCPLRLVLLAHLLDQVSLLLKAPFANRWTFSRLSVRKATMTGSARMRLSNSFGSLKAASALGTLFIEGFFD